MGLERTTICSWVPTVTEIKNDCVGKGLQQFTVLLYPERLTPPLVEDEAPKHINVLGTKEKNWSPGPKPRTTVLARPAAVYCYVMLCYAMLKSVVSSQSQRAET
jgi:hypothetical protein